MAIQITRAVENPLIRPEDVRPSADGLEVMCAFNAGATTMGGETILLVRVAERPIPRDGTVSTAVMDPDRPGKLREVHVRRDAPDLDASDPRFFTWRGVFYLTSVSHLRLARSRDGRRFTLDREPAIAPADACEAYGCEDARITKLGAWYYVNYSSIAPTGVTTSLVRTRDFRAFERLGIMFAPDNKDIAIFPDKIGGSHACFHRPSAKQIGPPSMWLAFSDNLLDWGRHRYVMGPRDGAWDSERVGCGAAPIRTDRGWLEFYHGANHQVRYCVGAVLLDLEQPWKVLARSPAPLLEPGADYEMRGLMPNVVFHNGLVERPGGAVDLYYGAADTSVCAASVRVADVLEWLRA
jgi:predicted GH43/DUF377 family glycosyl hydrolase